MVTITTIINTITTITRERYLSQLLFYIGMFLSCMLAGFFSDW